MPFSVPLTAPLVVGILTVKLVLGNYIFLDLIPLYQTWEQLWMVTTEIDCHSTFDSTVNPLVLLLDSFNVIFLKGMGHRLTCS